MAGRRPGGVTFVAVIVWIQALFNIIIGILALVGVPLGLVTLNPGFAVATLVIGIGYLLYGIIAAIVASGLLRGSRVARVIVTILLVLSIIGGIIDLVNGGIWSGIFNLAVGLIGILLLWAGKAARYFA
jgi:hypothetical protein